MNGEEAQIKDILTALEDYCLGDINNNREKPIALFMLCICCIDAMGALRYDTWNTSKRWEDFITTYMSDYNGLDLYNICRNNIIHSYTSDKKYAVSYDKSFTKPFDWINGILVINPYIFADQLENAIRIFKTELLTPLSDTRRNALEWDKKFPIMRATII